VVAALFDEFTFDEALRGLDCFERVDARSFGYCNWMGIRVLTSDESGEFVGGVEDAEQGFIYSVVLEVQEVESCLLLILIEMLVGPHLASLQ
jgi:hypothetical protein